MGDSCVGETKWGPFPPPPFLHSYKALFLEFPLVSRPEKKDGNSVIHVVVFRKKVVPQITVN